MSIAVVGIVGAGTMGGGIAINLAQHGLAVRLFDNRPDGAAKAIAQAQAFYERNVEKKRMSAAAAEAAIARLSVAPGLAEAAAADLVIEAVFEDFDLKAELLDELSLLVAPTTLVATNTSCLRVSDLAQHMAVPARFLGLHYFSPAAVNPIVEVVSGELTSAETIETALAFTRVTGKQPLRCRDAYGFAINRFFCPYTNEAVRALDEGLGTTAEIDLVAKEAVGAAAGPFLVMNLIKPRINLHAIRNLAPLGPFYAPAASMVATGETDLAWEIGEGGPIEPDRRQGIADRLRLGAFLPVLQAIDEGVAAPADFDRGAREALKMSRPPCAAMDELGRAEVERILWPALAAYDMPMPAAIVRVGRLLAD
jgi:3-hydroxybutyryl-CoA dehydrogenase